MPPVEHVVALSAALFAIGVAGVVARRNTLAVLLSIQLMLAAAGLCFVAFNRMWPGVEGAPAATGQVAALVVLAAAGAQLAIGLAIAVARVRNSDSVDVDRASELKW